MAARLAMPLGLAVGLTMLAPRPASAATGVLRVGIIQPGVCAVATTVYEYQAS